MPEWSNGIGLGSFLEETYWLSACGGSNPPLPILELTIINFH